MHTHQVILLLPFSDPSKTDRLSSTAKFLAEFYFYMPLFLSEQSFFLCIFKNIFLSFFLRFFTSYDNFFSYSRKTRPDKDIFTIQLAQLFAQSFSFLTRRIRQNGLLLFMLHTRCLPSFNPLDFNSYLFFCTARIFL